MQRFAGKTAIVTGAGEGLGRRIVSRLASEGTLVVVNDIDRARAEQTALAVAEAGGKTRVIVADVSQEHEVSRLFADATEAIGHIDIVVNNAAIQGKPAPVAETELAEWEKVLRIDLTGVFLCCRAAVRHMLPRQSGRIVNIASIVARDPNPDFGHYNVAKAGVITLTRTLAKEVGGSGITVNAVAPGLMQGTPMMMGLTPPQLAEVTAKILVHRAGAPEEVAAMVAFLASDEAGFTTGYCFNVAGGRGEF